MYLGTHFGPLLSTMLFWDKVFQSQTQMHTNTQTQTLTRSHTHMEPSILELSALF